MKWFKEHSVAIVLAFIAPFAIWYFWQRSHAGLRVVLTADIPILSVERQLSEEIKVTFQGREVTALRAIEVSIANSGNVPIERNHFDSPLIIGLPGRIAAAPAITVAVPASLEPSLGVVGDSQVVIQPLLLNPSDAFTFRAILSDWNDSLVPIRARSRISNVAAIEFADESRRPPDERHGTPWYIQALQMLGAIVGAVLVFFLAETVRRWLFRYSLPASLEGARKYRDELMVDHAVRERAADIRERAKREKPDILPRLAWMRAALEALLRRLVLQEISPPQRALSLSIQRPWDYMPDALQKEGILSTALVSQLRAYGKVSGGVERNVGDPEGIDGLIVIEEWVAGLSAAVEQLLERPRRRSE